MKINMTEALAVDTDSARWLCRKCGHDHGPADQNYKQGLLVHARDPREVHQALIDPARYENTFAPQPEWVRIVEYYCPQCALLVEAEYLPPGHPPLHDMQFSVESLRKLAAASEEVSA